jgi:hypothetical protein
MDGVGINSRADPAQPARSAVVNRAVSAFIEINFILRYLGMEAGATNIVGVLT